MDAAKRELYEESGAEEFSFISPCVIIGQKMRMEKQRSRRDGVYYCCNI